MPAAPPTAGSLPSRWILPGWRERLAWRAWPGHRSCQPLCTLSRLLAPAPLSPLEAGCCHPAPEGWARDRMRPPAAMQEAAEATWPPRIGPAAFATKLRPYHARSPASADMLRSSPARAAGERLAACLFFLLLAPAYGTGGCEEGRLGQTNRTDSFCRWGAGCSAGALRFRGARPRVASGKWPRRAGTTDQRQRAGLQPLQLPPPPPPLGQKRGAPQVPAAGRRAARSLLPHPRSWTGFAGVPCERLAALSSTRSTPPRSCTPASGARLRATAAAAPARPPCALPPAFCCSHPQRQHAALRGPAAQELLRQPAVR